MDLVTFLRVLLRRRGVVLPGLILTVVTLFAAGSSVASEYQAEGSLLLLGPSTANSSQGAVAINPYLNIPSSLDSTAAIIAKSMSSDETRRELADGGATADYELEPTQKTPILTVTAAGPSREQVVHTADLVLQRAQDELSRRQVEAAAPEQMFIRSEVLSRPRVTVHTGNKLRVMAAVGAFGVVITIMLAFAVENLAAWRTRRRPGAAPSSPGPALADHPLFSSQPPPRPALHLDAVTKASHSNGWQPQPPSAPLVDVVVEPADASHDEDAYETVVVEEVPAQKVGPGNNGNVEHQDGLVDAWWSAWERRQAGRRHAQGPLVEPAEPDEDWEGQADEAANEDAASMAPPGGSDDGASTDDEEVGAMFGDDLAGAVHEASFPEQAESVVAWNDQIEVLGATPRDEREAHNIWPYPAR